VGKEFSNAKRPSYLYWGDGKDHRSGKQSLTVLEKTGLINLSPLAQVITKPMSFLQILRIPVPREEKKSTHLRVHGEIVFREVVGHICFAFGGGPNSN